MRATLTKARPGEVILDECAGISELTAQTTGSLETLLAAADSALCRAKRAGRSQIQLSITAGKRG